MTPMAIRDKQPERLTCTHSSVGQSSGLLSRGDPECLDVPAERFPLSPANTSAKLYFECHVTIEPVFDERRQLAANIAVRHHFRLADLLMRKREADSEQRSAKDTFMTGHATELSYLQVRLRQLVAELRAAGFQVWRYKIEDTVVDSRVSDAYGLLGAAS